MNEGYFDALETPEQVYWLGFIVADGCVLWNKATGNYALQIALQGSDIAHLRMLQHDLGSTKGPQRDIRNGTVRVTWYSKRLAGSLIGKNVVPRKSGKEVLPAFPEYFARDFWRGVFDGDGCLAIQRKSSAVPEYRLSLAGSYSILNAFQAWACSAVGVRTQQITHAKNQKGVAGTYVFFMNGNRQVAALTTALY